ncbi:MAG TPA: plastocyanin/azurin family copper-binding protein [Egibacteraceae bacterium]|nr:plastocyanin/azurin family copper-binding protein [Egibacteraceae bacterium]
MRTRTLLALLLLTLLLPAAPASAGGGRCHEGFTDGQGPKVTTSGGCFLPTVVRVAPGDTVTWRSGDGVGHNVVTSAGFGGDLPPKTPLTHTFAEPGVYPYVCTLHPGMVGAVVVGDGIPQKASFVPASAAVEAGPADGAPRWALAAALGLLMVLALARAGMRKRRAAGPAPS